MVLYVQHFEITHTTWLCRPCGNIIMRSTDTSEVAMLQTDDDSTEVAQH